MHEVQRLDERWNRAYQTRDDAALEVSEFALRVFGDTAVICGRVRISGATFTVDQRFMRVWAQRSGVWQAVAVQVVPIASSGTPAS